MKNNAAGLRIDGGARLAPSREASADRHSLGGGGPAGHLRIAPAAMDAIRQHGRETYPHECCGALIGRDRDVAEAHPFPNTTEEGPRRRFLIGPRDYRSAEALARDGKALLGFYHSHPDHPARPSQYDLDHAWPSFSYVIVSVVAGKPGDVTSWRLRDDRTQFDEESLVPWPTKS